MRRETKFNYGFLFVSLAVPIIADYFLGRAWAVISAIVVAVGGFFFILSGHQHREQGEPPIRRSRLRRAMVLGLASAVIGAGAVGIAKVILKPPRPQIAAVEAPIPATARGAGATAPSPPPPPETKPTTKPTKQRLPPQKPKSQSEPFVIPPGTTINQETNAPDSANVIGNNNQINIETGHLVLSDRQQSDIASLLTIEAGPGEKIPIFVNNGNAELLTFAQRLAIPVRSRGFEVFVGQGIAFSSAGVPPGISLELPIDTKDPSSRHYQIADAIGRALISSRVVTQPVPGVFNKHASLVSIIISRP